MATRAPVVVGEWYHCFTRGVDKRVVFETREDYERFLVLLYAANGTRHIRVSDLSSSRLHAVLTDDAVIRGDPLTEIGAYSLMPTHPHFLLKETREGGIATFMQKVFTGYTMYFNNKNARTGALFSGSFKSKHIEDDRYLKQVLPYILLNPAELFEPAWKEGVANLATLEKKLHTYPFSSLPEFVGIKRPENKLVHTDFSAYYDKLPTLAHMLDDAHAYYRAFKPQV